MPVSGAGVIQGDSFSETSWFEHVRPGWRMLDHNETDHAKASIVCGKVLYDGRKHQKEGYECREIFYLNGSTLRWLSIEQCPGKQLAYSLWTVADSNGLIPPINATTLITQGIRANYIAVGRTILPHPFGTVNRSLYERAAVRLILQWYEGTTSKPGVLPILCTGRTIDPVKQKLALFSTP
jgi:hypothetical protein